MKSTNEILSDIWTILVASPIGLLNGGVYKNTRPTGSILQDCVIHMLPGSTAKFVRDGAIYIRLFYNDINKDNTFYEDSSVGQTLEHLLLDLSEVLLHTSGYDFDVRSRQVYPEAVPEIHQHYVILKMNFQLTI